MVDVKGTIKVRGNPLRQAYVEHIVKGIGGGMYLTDVNGEIRDVDFNKGIDSATNNADIRITCQNPVIARLYRYIEGTPVPSCWRARLVFAPSWVSDPRRCSPRRLGRRGSG